MKNAIQTPRMPWQGGVRWSAPEIDEWIVIPPAPDSIENPDKKSDIEVYVDSPEIALLLAAASPCHLPPLLEELLHHYTQISWETFEKIATEKGLLLLAEPRLRRIHPAPPLQRIREEARKNYFAALRRNLFLDNLTVQITMATAGAGLPTLLFTGTPFVRQFYGDLGVQAISGINLLVRREHVARSEKIMRSMEFHGPKSPRVSPHQNHHVMERNIGGAPVRVVIHWEFHSTASARLNIEDVWGTAVPYSETAARDLRWRGVGSAASSTAGLCPGPGGSVLVSPAGTCRREI